LALVTLKRPRLADRSIDLFSGTEFIAPEVACSSRQQGARKKPISYPDRCPSGGPYLF